MHNGSPVSTQHEAWWRELANSVSFLVVVVPSQSLTPAHYHVQCLSLTHPLGPVAFSCWLTYSLSPPWTHFTCRSLSLPGCTKWARFAPALPGRLVCLRHELFHTFFFCAATTRQFQSI
jgi:hypothetical protein